jgi:hypothetical protein
VIDVRSQTDDNMMFFLYHNDCKDSYFKARITRISRILKN